jgi:tetratricopeptide (TPR) repeat protein
VGSLFASSGRGHAAATSERVGELLEDYRDRYILSYRQICEATHESGEQSGQALDARMACLEDGLSGLSHLVDVWRDRMSPEVADDAIKAVRQLPSPNDCIEAPVGEFQPLPVDPQLRSRVVKARDALEGSLALQRAGLPKEALEAAKSIGDDIASVAPRDWAKILYQRSDLHRALMDFAEAEKEAQAAVEAAAEARSPHLMAEYWAHLAWVQSDLKNFDRARQSLEHARLQYRSLGREDDVELLSTELQLNVGEGKVKEALALSARVVELVRSEGPESAGRLAIELGNHADVLRMHGDLEKAAELLKESIAVQESLLGKDHPSLLLALASSSKQSRVLGRYDDATRAAERAADIAVKSFGESSPKLGQVLCQLGTVQREQDKHEESVSTLKRGVELLAGDAHLGERAGCQGDLASVLLDMGRYEETLAQQELVLQDVGKAYGKEHPGYGIVLINYGNALRAAQRPEEAASTYQRAAKVVAAALGNEHYLLGTAILGQGIVKSRLGQCERAVPHLKRALAIYRAALGSENRRIVTALQEVGMCQSMMGEPKRSTQTFEEALKMAESLGGGEEALAVPRILLAQNLYSDSRTRARAVELYGKARSNIPPDLETSEAEKAKLKALEAAWQHAQKGER